jgi:FkbM family methyltransferase
MNNKPAIYKLFSLMNFFWKHAYPLYRFSYWQYKKVVDCDLLRIMNSRVRLGMTALDIGANVGFFTLALSDRVGPGGIVHAFEPESENFRRLSQAAIGRTNVILQQNAVTDKSGIIRLYLSGLMNVDHQTYDNGDNRAAIDVHAIAIDDYLPSGSAVDFVKIDTQGYDYFVLQGMERTMRQSPSVTIVGEFWPYGLRKAGTIPLTYLELLSDFGFTVAFAGCRSAAYWCDRPESDVSYTYFVAEKRR